MRLNIERQRLLDHPLSQMMTEQGEAMADMWNKYEPTAARKRGKPGRETRPKSLTVDMHAHVVDAARRSRSRQAASRHVATIPLVHFSTPKPRR